MSCSQRLCVFLWFQLVWLFDLCKMKSARRGRDQERERECLWLFAKSCHFHFLKQRKAKEGRAGRENKVSFFFSGAVNPAISFPFPILSPKTKNQTRRDEMNWDEEMSSESQNQAKPKPDWVHFGFWIEWLGWLDSKWNNVRVNSLTSLLFQYNI